MPNQTNIEEIVSTVLSMPSAIRPADRDKKPKTSFTILSKT